MINAKKMFEVLGYTLRSDNDSCISYTHLYKGGDRFHNCKAIYFQKHDEKINVILYLPDGVIHDADITMFELAAIMQQCKELEWGLECKLMGWLE